MQWRKKLQDLIVVEHITKKEACKRIGQEFNISPSTIASYTAPSRYKCQSKFYNTRYIRIKREIDKILPQVFNNGYPELPVKEICNRIDNLTGVHLKRSSLENLLNKYVVKARDPPLIKTDSGQYRLNPSFYGNP